MLRIVCTGLLAMSCLGSAAANQLAYEGFDYAIGPLAENNGGSGFSSPWIGDPGVKVLPPGLAQPLALPSGGLMIGGSFNVARQLNASLNESVFWVSFEINSNPGNDQVWLGLDTAPNNLPVVAFGRRLNTYFIQSGASPSTVGGVGSPTGVTDLLVARFTRGGAFTNVDLWVDTNDFTLPPIISAAVPTVFYTWVNFRCNPACSLTKFV